MRYAFPVGIVALGLAAINLPGAADSRPTFGFPFPGAVYTTTNATGSNSLVVYERRPDGTLNAPEMIPTGGAGAGAGLGSQGAVALNWLGNWLLAVNAGSNDVSVFSTPFFGRPKLRGVFPSGGQMPISLTIHGDTAFVLNAGGSPNIAGFRLSWDGELTPIPGATRPLAGAGPAQVSFDSSGRLLVVTQKVSNTIEVYSFRNAQLAGPFIQPSAGQTPFGFGFGNRDLLVVSEAAGGAPGASTVSSYDLDGDGSLRLITAALPTTETAACWVAVTRNGRYAYTTNTGSGSVSSLRVGRDGSLALLDARAGETPAGTSPIDLAFSVGDQYMYVLASGTVTAFRVSPDGGLTSLGSVTGLPSSTVGMAAR